MKSRISIFFSAVALLITVSHIHTMQPAKRVVKATKKKFNSWVDAIENALTGETPTNIVITDLNNAPNNPLSNPNESDFYNLPQGERNQIVLLLSEFGSSNNLWSVGQVINSLAQVNKELNILININPKFYFGMSRGLAKRFGVSNEDVAKALQTERSKRELTLQQDLRDLCFNTKQLSDTQIASAFIQLMQKGIDVNFIYKDGKSPLIMAIAGNPTLAFLLLESGANVSINDEYGNKFVRAANLMGNDELVKAINEKLNQTK